MVMGYFKIIVAIKGRAKLLRGIRRYPIADFNKVTRMVKLSLLKYYFEKDILQIDICEVSEDSEEVREYLKRHPHIQQ